MTIKHLLKSFIDDRRGNFALLVVASVLPVFAAVGFAVDYARLSSARSDVQNASDAAVLAAVRMADKKIAEGLSESAAFDLAREEGAAIFEASIANVDIRSAGGLVISLRNEGRRISGTSSFSGEVRTTLMNIVGTTSAAFDVKSDAAVGRRAFIEVHMVFDVSASMGVGATARDHQIMAAAVGCAFACHTTNAHEPSWASSHQTVRAAGATLRIDAIKAAASDIVRDLRATGFEGRNLKFVIHTLSNNVRTVLASSSDLTAVARAIDGVDLTNANFQGGTNFEVAVDELERIIPISGDGTSELSPKRIMLLMTDGIETNIRFDDTLLPTDWASADPAHRSGEPAWGFTNFDGAICNDLKNRRGIDVHTLNARYIIPTVGTDADSRFSDIERLYIPRIQANMEMCASKAEHAYFADTPADIQRALDEFKTNLAKAGLVLTQ